MPLTLGIDCSLRWLNLGLADGERAIAETSINAGRRQSELLADETENFLARRGLTLKEVGLIAVTVGPGYYTGIRIGVAYATALAEALAVKVAPVMTFYAVAYDLLGSCALVAPAVRANNRTLYGALYKGHEEIFSGLYEPGQFADLLRTHRALGELIVTGPDVRSWQEFQTLEYPLLERAPSIGLNTALAAARLAAQEPAEVNTVYMREPD